MAEFMWLAVIASVAMSIFAPILGTFLILRRQSLMGDTLSHVSLFGVALGLVLGVAPGVTTLLVVCLVAVLLDYLQHIYRSYMEIATTVLMSTGLAFALIIMYQFGTTSPLSLDQYLFGSIVTITPMQVMLLLGIMIAVLVCVALFFRMFYIVTFDEATAQVEGLPVRGLSIAFNALSGVAIAWMIPAVGALLVSTILILPAAIALRLGKTFFSVFMIGIVLSSISLAAGLFASYRLDLPMSASTTLVLVSLFALVSVGKAIEKGRVS